MKNIILTGSSSGFGFLAVKILATAGHRVFATMRNVNGSNAAIANQLTTWAAENDAQVDIIELDVASNESAKKAVSEIIEKTHGIVDVLINNAGLSFLGIGETLSMEQVEQMYQVNTLGPERMMRLVLPYMHKQKEGLIINVTSIQTRNFIPILSIYNGTKAAVDASTVGYHYELKQSGIDVVSIQPGGYPATDMTTKSLKPANLEAEVNYHEDIHKLRDKVYNYLAPGQESRDPKEVGDVMLALIELPKGERPLWTLVGGGPLSDSFQEINTRVKKIVDDTMTVFLG
jgi:NAD(P)-dependent dehydrogenase (short-subunit alcohol dehydrogenase family)